MQQDQILKVFKQTQAIQSGHFLLTSGLHSDTYIQCARVLEQPELTSQLCEHLGQFWQAQKVDVVAGPAVGGIILAYELARVLKARAIFMERAEGKMTLRRGFQISPQEKVLVTEDVITTGGSVKEVIKTIKNIGAQLVGVASLVNRNPGINWGDVPFHSLLKVTPPVYQPKECPLCKSGTTAVKPGSRSLKQS